MWLGSSRLTHLWLDIWEIPRFSRRGFSILSVYVRDSSLAIREHIAHDSTSACDYS